MSTPRLLPLACVVVVTLCEPACIQVPDIEPARAQVRFVAPEGTAYTNGALEVRLEVEGHPPDRVELLRDGEVLAEVGPPYTYRWETAGEAEGTYRLEARAVLGEVAFESEAREVVVDRTPPRLVSRTPEAGAEDVWVRAPIRAVFSEPLRAATVSSESVRLTVGTVEVARTVSLSGDGRTLTVEPGAGYVPSNPVSLAFAAQVTDLAGNRVDTSGGAWSWKLPYWLPWGTADGALIPTTFGYSPYAFTPSGTMLTTWRAQDDSTRRTQLNHWHEIQWQEWNPSAPVNTGPTEGGDEPFLLDEAGRPVVAWTEAYGPSQTQIHVARWSGSTWESLGTPTPQNTGLPVKYRPALGWTPSRQIATAWMESNNSHIRVCLSVLRNNGWQLLGGCIGATHSLIEGDLSLRFTPQGAPVLSWMEDTGSVDKIYIATFVSGNWVFFHEDQESNQQLSYVSMQLDSAGNPNIAWTSESNGSVGLYIDRWIGDAWQNLAVALGAFAGNTPVLAHSLQLARDGTPLVAWSEQDTTGAVQLHIHQWNGVTWQSLMDESDPGATIGSLAHSLQRLSSGELILSWLVNNSGKQRLRVKRFNE